MKTVSTNFFYSVGLVALWMVAGVFVPALAQVAIQGQWTTLPSLMPINPVHMALLHNGKVLIVSGSGNAPSNTSFAAALWDPQTGTITTQPLAWDMFCNGMAILPDGRPMVVGGTLQYDPFFGQLATSAYDPQTGTFTDQASMAHGRWYPTVMSLGDGTLLTFSGLDETGATNKAVEIFTLGAGWSPEFLAPWTPPLYPRMHLLPNGTVFYSGSTSSSNVFDPATHTWTMNVAQTNFGGTRTYGTSVLLPLTLASGYRPQVFIMGGGNPATATTEIIDLTASSPQWVFGPAMSQPRVEMNATILPNGTVVALGGSANDEDGSTASFNVDIYDPAANSFTTGAPNGFPRLYHSNSLLLPDATVLVTGSNPARGTYEQNSEVYSPGYLFNADGSVATRPSITGVTPAAITYGGTFQLQTPDAATVSSVALMRPGAVTHAFDMEQRLVELSFTAGAGVLNVTAPPNGNIAPPGYYMVFILNSAGVPSVARFVNLSQSAAGSALAISPSSASVNTGGSQVFSASGGSSPYSYSIGTNNSGGTINTSSGVYTAGTKGGVTDTVSVTDTAGSTSNATVTVTAGACSAIAKVQVASAATTPTTSQSVSITETAGNLLVAAVYWNSSDVASISDTLGNTWSSVPVEDNSGTLTDVRIWYAQNIKGGANTITMTLPWSVNIGFYLIEYSGVATAGALDTTNGKVPLAASHVADTGNLTTSGCRDLIVALFADSWGTGNMTPGSGWISRGTDFNFYSLVVDNLPGGTGTFDPMASLADANSDAAWSATAAAFKAKQ